MLCNSITAFLNVITTSSLIRYLKFTLVGGIIGLMAYVLETIDTLLGTITIDTSHKKRVPTFTVRTLWY